MKDALDQLSLCINRHHQSLASLLQPGLQRPDIEELASRLPFLLGDDVYELYMWHNGTSQGNTALGETAIIPGTVYYFMPLEDAIEHYLSIGSGYRDAFDQLGAFGETIPIDLRNSHYLPILFDGFLGEFIVPMFESETCKSMVIEYVREVGPPKVAFSSIEAMIREITFALEDPTHKVLKRN